MDDPQLIVLEDGELPEDANICDRLRSALLASKAKKNRSACISKPKSSDFDSNLNEFMSSLLKQEIHDIESKLRKSLTSKSNFKTSPEDFAEIVC